MLLTAEPPLQPLEWILRAVGAMRELSKTVAWPNLWFIKLFGCVRRLERKGLPRHLTRTSPGSDFSQLLSHRVGKVAECEVGGGAAGWAAGRGGGAVGKGGSGVGGKLRAAVGVPERPVFTLPSSLGSLLWCRRPATHHRW